MHNNFENTCSAFFDKYEGTPNKVELLHQLEPKPDLIGWESLCASKYSQNPVNDNELLYRYVFNPIHMDIDSKELKPTAITDVKDKGLSVNRVFISTKTEIISMGKNIANSYNSSNPSKPSRQMICIAKLEALNVRSIMVGDNNETRAFCIFDTAQATNHAHADIYQCISDKKNKQAARSARSRLYELATKNLEFVFDS